VARRRLWKLPTTRGKALLPEDECEGCGIGYLGLIETVTPFLPACLDHDRAYDAHERGTDTRSRAEVDRAFLEHCLRLAGRSLKLRALAYVYYGLARTFGGLFW